MLEIRTNIITNKQVGKHVPYFEIEADKGKYVLCEI